MIQGDTVQVGMAQEADLDAQVLSLFDRMRVKDQGEREWFAKVLLAKKRTDLESTKQRVADLQRQITGIREQQERLLDLRLLEEIDSATLARKSTELRDRLALLTSQVDAKDSDQAEYGIFAAKVLELLQSLKQK